MPVLADSGCTALITQRGTGTPVFVLGAEITIKIRSSDTNGAFTVFEGLTAPLQGPSCTGTGTRMNGGTSSRANSDSKWTGGSFAASAGDTVFAPRGSRHTFQNVGSIPGRTLTTAVPGGIDDFFKELETVAPRGSTPDFAKLKPIFEKHRQELLGPPPAARAVANTPERST